MTNPNTPAGWDSAYAAEQRSGKRRIDDLRLGFLREHINRWTDSNQHRELPMLLDVGCGDGEMLRLLHAFYPHWNLYGVDFAESTICRAQLWSPQLTLRAIPIDELCAWQEFDVVWCGETLEHLDAPEEAIERMARALRLGGRLVCSVPNEHGNPSPDHMREFSVGDCLRMTEPWGRLEDVRVVRGDGWESVVWCTVRETTNGGR